MSTQANTAAWKRRKLRVRKKVSGTAERPRMTVFKSNKHIYAQVIDDVTGKTLAAASTQSEEIRAEAASAKKTEAATLVGTLVAKRCADAKIDAVVFDRNGYKYTGRIAAVADAAREGGLKL
jgi:large subunit ribosomal protein L18